MLLNIILALRKYNSDTPLNIGTGKTHSIKEAKKLIKMVPEIKIKWKKKEETGIKIKRFNIKRAKKDQFYPRTSLDDGLVKPVEWFKEIK